MDFAFHIFTLITSFHCLYFAYKAQLFNIYFITKFTFHKLFSVLYVMQFLQHISLITIVNIHFICICVAEAYKLLLTKNVSKRNILN